ncbi:MAG: hypothetical protein M1140_06365 [Chloroflexi bacterium]|nr:hypothetical protein [Chloroflexota bacterium]
MPATLAAGQAETNPLAVPGTFVVGCNCRASYAGAAMWRDCLAHAVGSGNGRGAWAAAGLDITRRDGSDRGGGSFALRPIQRYQGCIKANGDGDIHRVAAAQAIPGWLPTAGAVAK